MNPSRGRLIADVIQARLADLVVGNGYTTNAGTNVLPIGQAQIDPVNDGVPAVVQFPGQITAPELDVAAGISDGVLVREWGVDLVETLTDRDSWFYQAEDLTRDLISALMAPSTDSAKNWRSRALGVKHIALAGTQVEPPPEGADFLMVNATIAVRFVEKLF